MQHTGITHASGKHLVPQHFVILFGKNNMQLALLSDL